MTSAPRFRPALSREIPSISEKIVSVVGLRRRFMEQRKRRFFMTLYEITQAANDKQVK
jgi:hypothetical protein